MKLAPTSKDFRSSAKKKIPNFLFEYYDGGSFSEKTLERNLSDLDLVELKQRVMTGVDRPNTSIELLGENWAMPLALSPVGLAGLAHRRGEVQAAKAAAKAGIPFCLSTVSACPVEEVRRDSKSTFWLQLYMAKDRAFMSELLDVAKAQGCQTLVFTVDLPVPGPRYRDLRSGLNGSHGVAGQLWRTMQALKHPAWCYQVGVMGRPHSLGNVARVMPPNSKIGDFLAWMGVNFDPTVTWQDIEWIRTRWQGPLLIKGILEAKDAAAALEAGADGIVVSNHGGRQLDGVSSTARALPSIAQAVGGKMPILVDGGIRSGIDVLRMLALGASAAMIGRPWVYALASGGESAVLDLLLNFKKELETAMILTGSSGIDSVSESCFVNF